mmetsp:Transcript_130506/g.226787  ORF Transcript_130506/g.226787 Transcript_130506/m.226787 type:complete len:262 (-) Transcript_130506:94-879(-)
MGRTPALLFSSLLFLVADFASCTQACTAPDCTLDEEGAGLQMLQKKASQHHTGHQPDAQARAEACALPDERALQAKGKRCPPAEGPNSLPCLNKNKDYETLEQAWAACGRVEDCDSVMQYTDGRWYLRRATDPDISGEGLKLYVYTCMPTWLGQEFWKTQDVTCGWAADDGDCQENNFAAVNAGSRNATNIDREQALAVCGRICNINQAECGGFFYNATERACFFRRNARCGVVDNKGHDCYARETEATRAIKGLIAMGRA